MKNTRLIQLAATADLVGLRATQLKIKKKPSRKAAPAIVIIESGSVVA